MVIFAVDPTKLFTMIEQSPSNGVRTMLISDANLNCFLEEVMNADLFVNLCIGPSVHGEWNYGELPA